MGVTICPKRAVAMELNKNELIVLNWDQNGLEVPILMIWHREKWCSFMVKDFMTVAEEIISTSALEGNL